MDEGKAVAAAAGIELHEDPWEMNVHATQRGSAHYPSMLEDVEAHRPTEIELITGSLVREAERLGVPVPLHTTLYRLIKAKEAVLTAEPGIQREAGMTAGKRWGAFGALLAVSALAVAAVGTGVGGSATKAQAPIVIGWAFDSKGNMAPFDGPALAAAKIRVDQINAKGGVNGRPLRIDTCDTNNNNPAKAKSCAASLLGKGANVIFTTCDVDFATPVVQESIKARQADDRAVHRHRPDGAEAVRHGGQAGVQLRQRRPGRGLRDGGVRVAQGLADGEPGHEHAARLLQERRPGVRQALHAARRQDRRP